ncbi:hypothetical protein EVB99_018 [Rhizobium phage RHph_N3_19]|nr:hypothetical protein EVB99_018 [Rhizobium phage RHph_N3_19]
MTKVFITGLDDLSVGDILFHPGDEHVYSYRVREIEPNLTRCIGLGYKRHTAVAWIEMGMFPLTTAQQMYKLNVMYKYDPNQQGDRDDDI